MKLTKSQLRQIIKEELETLPEASIDPWGNVKDAPPEAYDDEDEDVDPTEKYNAPVYQLNDQLVTAAKNALLEVVEAKIAPNLIGDKEQAAALYNFELEIEEPLMDFLLPYAEQLMRTMSATTAAPEDRE